MALNKKKREERVLKSDQMIQEAIEKGAVNPGTSSEAILGELNKELKKEEKAQKSKEEPKAKVEQPKEERPVAKETAAAQQKTVKKDSKRGRKKTYEGDRYLIHLRVDETLRERLDAAVTARRQTMQDYLTSLVMEDIEKNGTNYDNIYKSMKELEKSIR
ncbi:MAG: hypothetical protein J5959_09980 [Butyrivibrio sp.]|nr:hypothetical protein [Butyrivibrio sp.]